MSRKKTQTSEQQSAGRQSASIFNPFEGRDPERVWEEIRKNAKPTTREEAFRKMQSLKNEKEKNHLDNGK